MINANIAADVRIEGYKALANALGPVGMVRFIQQFDSGHGDYTKEKYEIPDNESWDDIKEAIKEALKNI